MYHTHGTKNCVEKLFRVMGVTKKDCLFQEKIVQFLLILNLL